MVAVIRWLNALKILQFHHHTENAVVLMDLLATELDLMDVFLRLVQHAETIPVCMVRAYQMVNRSSVFAMLVIQEIYVKIKLTDVHQIHAKIMALALISQMDFHVPVQVDGKEKLVNNQEKLVVPD